jgi:hypothetical protein
MGAGNSPSIAGRHGAAVLRKARILRDDIFSGKPTLNTWWSHYGFEQHYDPKLGHGIVYLGNDGLPAVLIWAHCDDFLVHGPTYTKTAAALTAFLDLTVQLGLLCHPGKLTPPALEVKYTGLIFDTSGVPTIRIPEYKRAKAAALAQYAIDHRGRLSRLALAVIVGVLESLVEATPSRLGHSYLRNLQETLHRKGWDGLDLPYYSFAPLNDKDVDGLTNWLWLLNLNPGRAARGHQSGVLVPSMGDGSGTGTGGTVLYDDVDFEMWMGTWSPRLYRFSAVWKEMRTLLATLERAWERQQTNLLGVTFFYFTDNMATYYAVSKGSSKSPGLHSMVTRIKQLEIMLGCFLEVIHVPGTTIITEGTDDLSRGIWMSALHHRPSQRKILTEIFAPLPHSPDVSAWAVNQVGYWGHPCHYRSWNCVWDPEACFDRLTLWCPPPELAPQLLYFLLQCYVERPATTSMLVVLPRTLQRKWARASRHVVEIGVYQRATVPFVNRSFLTIPIILLLIPFYVRTLPSDRLDQATPTSPRLFHRQQATLVRGLLETFDSY